MGVFWMLAGLLVLVSMLFIVPPLLRQPRLRGVQRDALNVQVIRDQLAELRADLDAGRLDQAAYAEARRDVERELLEDVEVRPDEPVAGGTGGRWLAVVLVLLVPAMAVTIYQRIGTQTVIERLADGGAGVVATPTGQHSLETMVQKLAERLQNEPDNAEGWSLLGRSYAALGRSGDALAAYRHALQLSPDDPDILSSFADVLIMANKGEFSDEVGQLLDKALAADPQYPKALWLRGHWRFRHADYAGAITDWRAVMAELPPNDENVATIQEQIRVAQGQLGQPLDEIRPAAQQQTGTASTGASAGGSIQVHVALDPALANKASPDDTVFIFARAVQGPRMPLAIVRKRVADLPVDVTLDDSMAMSPAMVLSKFGTVTVGARVSKSGQAMPSSGDLEGAVSPVATHGAKVTVTINAQIEPAAQQAAGGAVAAAAPTAATAAPAAATAADGSIQVHVALDPALANKASPDDTVFIFARAVQGPRMPLAIVRKRVADLPVDVTLDDSMAMSPAMVLSKFGTVTVGARVSKSGQAMPSSGDLEGMVSPVPTHGAKVAITVDQIVP